MKRKSLWFKIIQAIPLALALGIAISACAQTAQSDGHHKSTIEARKQCQVINGLFKFQSADGYRKNEILISLPPQVPRRYIVAIGTWKPIPTDDGGNTHSGRLEGELISSACTFSFPTENLDCKVDLQFFGKKKIEVRQQGFCLTFGSSIDLNGTYTQHK